MTTTSQPDNLLDFGAAQEAKVEAVARVESHANARWLTTARQAVGWLALTQPSFTTDDVWRVLAGRDASTHEPRALGAVMKQAARLGYCTASETWQQSARSDCHGRPVRVWTSLLFDRDPGSLTVVESQP